MGLEDRAADRAELAQMIALLDEGLRAGALGLSSGLFTPPGSFASADEMMALCAVVKRHKARLFHPYPRRIEQGAGGGRGGDRGRPRLSAIHVEIVHLKCSGVDNWGKAGEILEHDRRRRAPPAATSIATPTPMPPAPIR